MEGQFGKHLNFDSLKGTYYVSVLHIMLQYLIRANVSLWQIYMIIWSTHNAEVLFFWGGLTL